MNDKILNIYCDGGARGNPGPAASAFIVKDATGKILHQQGFFLGIATNNQAEYQAVIESLKWLLANGETVQLVNYYLDSLLVVNQLNKEFKVKEINLKEKCLEIKNYLERLGRLEIRTIFIYIPRSQNFLADRLVNHIIDNIQ